MKPNEHSPLPWRGQGRVLIAAPEKKFRVLHLDYTVEFFGASVSSAANKLGWHHATEQKICLSSELLPQQMADTFIHELLHALCWVLDIRDGVSEESLCTRLSTGMCSVQRDNPEWFDWWKGLLK